MKSTSTSDPKLAKSFSHYQQVGTDAWETRLYHTLTRKEAALDEAYQPSSSVTLTDVGIAAKSGLTSNMMGDRGLNMNRGAESMQLKYMGDDRLLTGDLDKDQRFIWALTYRDLEAKQKFNQGMGGNYGGC